MTKKNRAVDDKGVQEASKEQNAEAPDRIEDWELDRLHPHPMQAHYFGPLQESVIAMLVDSMAHNGQECPVEATADGTLICGHHRVEAARRLGWETIRVRVRHDLVDAEAIEERLIDDNATRRHMGPCGLARCVARLKELARKRGTSSKSGGLRDWLEKQFPGRSGRTLERHLKLLELPIEFQRAVDQGGLGIMAALAVLKLPEDEQQRCAERIAAGESPSEVLDQAKAASPASAERLVLAVDRALPRLLKPLEGRLEEIDVGRDEYLVKRLQKSQGLLSDLIAAVRRSIERAEVRAEADLAELQAWSQT